jgi:hypothetical protein
MESQAVHFCTSTVTQHISLPLPFPNSHHRSPAIDPATLPSTHPHHCNQPPLHLSTGPDKIAPMPMPLSTPHFYIHPDDQPDPVITLALSDAVRIFKLLLAYSIFHCLFARRASLSAATALYLIALSLLCGFEAFEPFGVDAAMAGSSSPTNTAAISTVTSISGSDTCIDGQPAAAPSTHVSVNAMRILQFSLLTFVVFRLLARYASNGALVGLSLIAGGLSHDFRVGLHGVDAATTTTTTTTVFESAVEHAASGRPRSSTTLWILWLALTILALALLTARLIHRRLLGPSILTRYHPLVGRMLVIEKPVALSMEGVRECDRPLNSMTIITTGSNTARHPTTTRTNLVGTLLLALTLLAILIPLAFAADTQSSPGLTKRSAQGDVSPIWITYYSTTTTWLPAVTVTAPPVVDPSSTPTGSTDGTAAGTDGLGSSMPGGSWASVHVCTEVEQAVCPIVEGRKTGQAHVATV